MKDGTTGLNIAWGAGVMSGMGIPLEDQDLDSRERYAISRGAFDSQYMAGHRYGRGLRWRVSTAPLEDAA